MCLPETGDSFYCSLVFQNMQHSLLYVDIHLIFRQFVFPLLSTSVSPRLGANSVAKSQLASRNVFRETSNFVEDVLVVSKLYLFNQPRGEEHSGHIYTAISGCYLAGCIWRRAAGRRCGKRKTAVELRGSRCFYG